jgi:hypothetical protein
LLWAFSSSPLALEEIIDGGVYETRIDSVEKAFDKADDESQRSQPFEPRKSYFKELGHVQAFRDDEPIGNADEVTEKAKDTQ